MAIAVDAGAAVGNAGFADLGEGALVVDCGFTPAGAKDLRAAAEQTFGDVRLLVITHADFDHYGGAQEFGDVPILASEQTRAAIGEDGPGRVSGMQARFETYVAELEAQGAPDWEVEQGRRILAEVPGIRLTLPTESFSDERDLGAARVIDCGTAHTFSDSVVWLPETRVLFVGDLMSVDSHLNLRRDPENWLRILDRLEALEPRHIVSGHGPVAGAEAISIARRYIETLLALAAEPGDPEVPAELAGLGFADGFRQNIEALRSRS